MSYYLGCDFERDEDGVLHFVPKKYIEKMEELCDNMFGPKLKQICISPLDKGYNTELDTYKFLDQNETQEYQYLIGAIQWAAYLRRLDVNTAGMTLASFGAEPREGHLDRSRRVASYLVKCKHATMIIRTEEPDVSSASITPYEWEKSVYGKFTKLLPEDSPGLKGKHVVTIS